MRLIVKESPSQTVLSEREDALILNAPRCGETVEVEIVDITVKRKVMYSKYIKFPESLEIWVERCKDNE